MSWRLLHGFLLPYFGVPVRMVLGTASGRPARSDAMSEQPLTVGGGETPTSARRPGRRIGLERRLDGGRDELRGLRVDDDVPAEQHTADDLPGMPGHILRVGGQVSPPS